MSYQVLARKWRPQNFKQMVGQEHVLRALMNALDSDRLHHAYLFTGTRGVGKTTIARILAKCLNCETGITSTPCGECNSCKEIAAGNFLDLIEVDAASRTKVEDTRELLENVQYAPTRARFKVYLIDEVHMLTGHSFNALLKTLEEPPPHVKFLFATTDPQKLPATILSRCLQFNLKRMPVDMITGHLEYLLGQETIKFEQSSLRLLGRAADGSMRDALSLLDQAIAFSGSELTEASVRDMLGTISHEPLIDLLELILAGDGATLLQRVEDLSSVTPDFDAATDALISLLHQLAVQQVVPDAINDEDSIRELANKITKEEVQLFYQIALQGRRDLPLSPDPRSGFEMLLLRMMSFRPLREGMKLEAPQIQQSQTSESSTDASLETPTEIEKKKTIELDPVESITPAERVAETNTTEPIIPSVPETQPQPRITTTTENEPKRNSSTPASDSVPPWEDIPPELEENYSSAPTQNPDTKAESESPVEEITVEETTTVNDSIVDKPVIENSSIKNSLVESSLTKNTVRETTSKSVSIEDLLLADDIYQEDVDDIKSSDDADDEVLPESNQKQEIGDTREVSASTTTSDSNEADPNQPWYLVVPQLKLSGRANELIKHCLIDSHENGIISLVLNKDSEGLLAESTQQEIQSALIKFYGKATRLDLRIAESINTDNTDRENETPAQRSDRKILETQQQAEHNIQTDPFVQELQSRFGAQIVPGSIKAKQTNN